MAKKGRPKESDKVTPKKRARFLGALAEHGTVLKAATIAGITRWSAYRWREKVEGFAEAWQLAVDEYTEKLEQEADRRAVEGVNHPVTYQGEITDTYKEYSDILLMFRLKALQPNKYRDNTTVEHTGDLGLRVIVNTNVDPNAGKSSNS